MEFFKDHFYSSIALLVAFLFLLGACAANPELGIEENEKTASNDSADEAGGNTSGDGGDDNTDDFVNFGPCDIDPDNEDCQQSTFPIHDDIATAAFEDVRLEQADMDFNDFVYNFSIQEIFLNGSLVEIRMEFIPRARGAGFEHSLMMILDGVIDNSNNDLETPELFAGDADVILRRYAFDEVVEQVNYEKSENIDIFPSTSETFGYSAGGGVFVNVLPEDPYEEPVMRAELVIELSEPELNPLEDRSEIDLSRYRMVLDVHDTNMDVDLAEVAYADGPPNGGFEEEPAYGMIVPTDWAWPVETENIEDGYPYFAEYLDYLLAGDLDEIEDEEIKYWFDYPAQNAVENGFIYPIP